MRKSILLYLLAFAVIIILTQYVNSSKILEAQNEDIAWLKENLDQAQVQIDSLQQGRGAGVPFSLIGNEDAISVLENRGFDAQAVIQKIEDELLKQNLPSQDNKLVPYEGMEGVMRINRIHVLNHKWILANFTDGTHWGELFLTFDLQDDGSLIIETQKAVLFPKT